MKLAFICGKFSAREYLDFLRKDTRYLQYTSAFCVGILQLSINMHLTWPSPILPRLLTKDSPIGNPLTNDEASWVVSCKYLSMLIGALLLVLLLDRIGPKCVLLLGACLNISSWIILGVAKSFESLVIGRMVAGIGCGISFPCIYIYVCEIASKDIRGRLGAIPVFVGVFGNLFNYGAGPHVTYTMFTICGIIVPAVFFVFFFFMPNSPYYLVKKGRGKEAENVSMALSSKTTSRSDIEAMIREVEETVKRDTHNKTLMQSLLTPNFGKAVLIVSAAMSIAIFSGMDFVSAYFQVILESSSVSLSKELSSLIFGLVQVPSVMVSGLLLDKFGRRPLLCFSSFCAGVAIFAEGVYLYLQKTVDLNNIAFVPALCLISFKMFASFGILYLPAFIRGELFAIGAKKVGNLITSCYSNAMIFAHLKVLGSVYESWEIYTICWFSGGFCFLGAIFSFYLLPETKGKTFNEIQTDLSSTRNDNN